MPYVDDMANLLSEPLLLRIEAAAIKAAQAIRNESEATANHVRRVQLASLVARDSQALRMSFARLMVVAASPVVTASSTDVQLDTAVAQVWNTLAGKG